MSGASFDDSSVDKDRRRFLTAGTCVVGAVGAAAASVPFIASFPPSEKAKTAGAPVEVDISKLQPGMKITIKWRGKPVWLLRRTPEMLASLKEVESRLADPASEKTSQQPAYAQNETRSIKPEILVMVGICTHLGCSPTFRPEVAPQDLGENWVGGFFCPCHGSRFDLAGRVFKSMPAPSNMVIPPYHYVSENLLVIGDEGEKA